MVTHSSAAPAAAAKLASHHIPTPVQPPTCNPLGAAEDVAAVELAVAVAVAVPNPVLFAPISASHVVILLSPKNLPAVCASDRCILCRSVVPSVALVAQNRW